MQLTGNFGQDPFLCSLAASFLPSGAVNRWTEKEGGVGGPLEHLVLLSIIESPSWKTLPADIQETVSRCQDIPWWFSHLFPSPLSPFLLDGSVYSLNAN